MAPLLKYCLLAVAVVLLFCMQGSAIPTPPKELRFENELTLNTKGSDQADCIDETDCDPYGTYMCTGPAKDKRWAQACCREYCNFCNATIPKKQNCEYPPPSYYY